MHVFSSDNIPLLASCCILMVGFVDGVLLLEVQARSVAAHVG